MFRRPLKFLWSESCWLKRGFSSTLTAPSQSEGVKIEMNHGLPYVTVPLPSRDEDCVFVLRPISQNVGDFLAMLKDEDKGVDRAVIRALSSGVRISSTSPVQTLLNQDFSLLINDKEYKVCPPRVSDQLLTENPLSDSDLALFGDVRARISQLFGVLHVGEYLAQQEEKKLKELEEPKQELALLEPEYTILSNKANKLTERYLYYFLFLPAFQFGFLARLTWFEYSWDIMEPVTYFVTAFSGLLCLKYFIMTKNEYQVPSFEERIYLIHFHKQAAKVGFDVKRYLDLTCAIAKKEKDVAKIRELKTLGIAGSF
ncbi:calcium uniporter protein, mitochondrial [Lepeophtheirus salmonis]|uniref:Calcium uniporter protein n=1 Tax=Lepeophtheirus salmonis TaxID=72036 RepID=A0A0K2UH91_LEPSM|nr:calcium uniporter protein, mitochondrial-like [Lepeophtheirus salmonis]